MMRDLWQRFGLGIVLFDQVDSRTHAGNGMLEVAQLPLNPEFSEDVDALAQNRHGWSVAPRCRSPRGLLIRIESVTEWKFGGSRQ